MKQMILFIVLIAASLTATSQTVTKDSKGNYVAVSSKSPAVAATATGKTFTDLNGKVYPVFLSIRGKLFINRVSRTGSIYKYYLKP